MFIMSMKVEKKKMLTWSIIIAALILVLVGLWIFLRGKSGENPASAKTKFDAANNSERVAFLESFGWDVGDGPIEVCEIIMPDSFDEVFKKYNELQKSQGLNLEDFKGKRTKRWTYTVLNYPSDEEVHANVIVHENKIIAGDICSTALGGFIHGFKPEETGAFAENGLTTGDLPIEFSGIKQVSKSTESEPAITDKKTEDKATEGVKNEEGTDKKAKVNSTAEKSEAVDDIEQKARDEIEQSLEMLIEAAEDKEKAQ